MRRTILLLGFLLAALVPASAEEFVLKDGTKILGRMVAVKGDKIEVETAYGKMQIRRSDILSINFPENAGTAVSQSSSDSTKPKPVDESLTGTQYVNRTGHCTLTVPIESTIKQRMNLLLAHWRAIRVWLNSHTDAIYTILKSSQNRTSPSTVGPGCS